jgi:hypothetical protein
VTELKKGYSFGQAEAEQPKGPPTIPFCIKLLIKMQQFISEQIIPHAGTSDAQAMGRGEPGLPAGFSWRDVPYEVRDVLEAWKETSREGVHAQGQLYLRRHAYRLLMSDGTIWSVYFIRQTPKSGNPKARWFLYSIETTSTGNAD